MGRSGTQEQLKDFNAWQDGQVTYNDEVPDEEVSPELLDEVFGKVMNFDELQRINPKIPPMSLVNQDLFYLKYGNFESKIYVPSLHKIYAFLFPEDDLEEQNTRWAQQGHIRRRLKTKDDFKVVHSEKKIVDVVRVQFDQESDYRYLHKNDIEDMYLMCINGIIKDYRQTGLVKSLTLFIKSCVYWERVHDYQLGMESYQQKVNLTTPTITFFGIKKEKLLTITSDPVVGLIYENNNQEKRVMDIKEISKFCDATMKRVLEKVKKFNLDVKHGYADPDLHDEDAEYIRDILPSDFVPGIQQSSMEELSSSIDQEYNIAKIELRRGDYSREPSNFGGKTAIIYKSAKRDEVIIVDDGSPNGRKQVAFDFVGKYKLHKVRVILLGKNQGNGEAVRKRMCHSRGKLLLMLEANGVPKVDDLAKLENHIGVCSGMSE
nr:nucleotide-diphospho-sugar transferases superfamily protein [Tanacetum cinerariifolium]